MNVHKNAKLTPAGREELVKREDLVAAKLDWAKKGESELRLRDVRAILNTANPGFDRGYVVRWGDELGLSH